MDHPQTKRETKNESKKKKNEFSIYSKKTIRIIEERNSRVRSDIKTKIK